MTVLTLALILGSISVASAAKGDPELSDIAGNANEEAIKVAYDLNIVTGTPEGTYEPDKAVNRAEFATLITKALRIPDSALSYYGAATFKDTAGYSWAVPYLAVLQQRGIMKGDGYGNAMPGRDITPNEAVTMVLRAIGYTDNASVLVGQWPANYVALGQSLNLYAKVANDTKMTKASAAQMIYNVLTKQLVQVDANSTVKYLYDTDGMINNTDEQTLLTQNLNCRRERDVVVSYADADTSKIDLLPYVGAFGTLFISKADEEVVAVADVSTTFLVGRFTYANAQGASTNQNLGQVDKFKAVDGTEYSLDLAAAKAVVDAMATRSAIGSLSVHGKDFPVYSFFNGQDGTSVGAYVTRYHNYVTGAEIAAYVPPASGAMPSGNLNKLRIAAKVNGKTITELRSVAVWDAAVTNRGDAFLFEAGMIDGTKFNGHNFPVDVNNARDDYKYVLEGVDSLDDIAVDNVIYLYKDQDDKKIRRIEVGTDTQSGTITNVDGKDTKTIGGKVLSLAPYEGAHIATAAIGNEGVALLDVYGRLYDFQLGEASKGNFAMLVGAGNDIYTGGGVASQFKLFDKTGAEVVYSSVSSGVKVFTTNNASGNVIARGTYAPQTIGGGNAPLVEYKLSGGKLESIIEGINARTPIAGVYGSVNKAGTILTVPAGASNLTSADSGIFDSNAVLYVYNTLGDYTDVSLGSIKDIADTKFDQPFWYYKDDKGKIKAMLVYSGNAGAQNVFVMINGLSDAWDNGTVKAVSGLIFSEGQTAAGKFVANYVDNNLIDKLNPRAALTLGPTDLGNILSMVGSYTYTGGRYTTMVQFRMGEDGVLKDAKNLRDLNSDNFGTAGGTDVAIINAILDPDSPLSGSTVILATGSAIATPGLSGWTGNEYGSTIHDASTNPRKFVSLEPNAVLYKLSGTSWTANRITTTTLKDDDTLTTDLYVFLKTSKDLAGYDVMIKVR
jgi:hypothetical protein